MQTASNNPVSTVQVYNPVDSIQEYTQRADTVTLSVGNAQEVNSRIHVIDPWPRYVGDTRIPANGERMATAVYRYRCGKSAPPPLPVGSTSAITQVGLAVGAAVGGERPGSECAGAQGQVSGTTR
jgi:hypothetical protein